VNCLSIILAILTFTALAALRGFGRVHLFQIPALLIGENRVSLWLYALMMLPGTLLHEISHALAAFALGVEVDELSLRPSTQGEWITLGYVQHQGAGLLRQALIGLAPLLAGTLALLLVGLLTFNVVRIQEQVAAGEWFQAVETLISAFSTWKGWLGAYLIFIVSASMFPSPSDQRAWLPVGLFLILLLAPAFLAGLGPAVLGALANPINTLFNWLLLVFGLALAVNVPFVLFLTVAHEVVARQFPRA
jgi:hypothetical protein